MIPTVCCTAPVGFFLSLYAIIPDKFEFVHITNHLESIVLHIHYRSAQPIDRSELIGNNHFNCRPNEPIFTPLNTWIIDMLIITLISVFILTVLAFSPLSLFSRRCQHCGKKRSAAARFTSLDKNYCDDCLDVLNQEIRDKKFN